MRVLQKKKKKNQTKNEKKHEERNDDNMKRFSRKSQDFQQKENVIVRTIMRIVYLYTRYYIYSICIYMRIYVCKHIYVYIQGIYMYSMWLHFRRISNIRDEYYC